MEFINSSTTQVNQLNLYFKNKNIKEMGNITHKLKSTFKYLGMKNIEATMDELDKLCNNNGDLKLIGNLLNEATLYFENAKKEIVKELSKLKAV